MYPYVLYIYTPKTLKIKNFRISNNIIINYPAVMINSISRRTRYQNEFIELDNMQLEKNLLLLDMF